MGTTNDPVRADGDSKTKVDLFIFVNRRKFDENDGVRAEMKGREIAALVNVPPDIAIVRRGNTAESPVVGLDETLELKQAEHFLVTRRIVEGGFDVPPRIKRELDRLKDGGQHAEYSQSGGREIIIYRAVPTAGAALGLPGITDAIAPVPSGYPGAAIDLAGLPVGSPFLGRVKGAANQGVVSANGVDWQLVSNHPHGNGGGQPWDQNKHGFHTYFDEILAWLTKLA